MCGWCVAVRGVASCTCTPTSRSSRSRASSRRQNVTLKRVLTKWPREPSCGKWRGSTWLYWYHFGSSVIRSLLNGPSRSVWIVWRIVASPWWIHAYDVVPTEKCALPSACTNERPLSCTRTGLAPAVVAAATRRPPRRLESAGRSERVSYRHTPGRGGMNRTRKVAPPSWKPRTWTGLDAPPSSVKTAKSSTSNGLSGKDDASSRSSSSCRSHWVAVGSEASAGADGIASAGVAAAGVMVHCVSSMRPRVWCRELHSQFAVSGCGLTPPKPGWASRRRAATRRR